MAAGWILSEHEAAGMLRQVPGRADQLARQLQREREPRVRAVEVERVDMAIRDALFRPAPYLAGERGGHVLGQTQRLADLAHRAARTEAADDRSQRGMVMAVLSIDPLDHLLAALVLEIDVDVGRLAAVL
jgi:hypothetical protein